MIVGTEIEPGDDAKINLHVVHLDHDDGAIAFGEDCGDVVTLVDLFRRADIGLPREGAAPFSAI